MRVHSARLAEVHLAADADQPLARGLLAVDRHRVLEVAEQDVGLLVAMSAALATIFSFEKSRKWIIRDGADGDLRERVRRADRQGLEEVTGVAHVGARLAAEVAGSAAL